MMVETSMLSFSSTVLLSMMLYLDVDLEIWNYNMIVLDSGCVPTMSSRVTTPSGYDLSLEKLISGVVRGLRLDLMSYRSFLKQCSYIMSNELPLSMYIL